MRPNLAVQVGLILAIALLGGIANNLLRPKTTIEWVRAWPDYAGIAPGKETAPAPTAAPEKAAATPILDAGDPGETAAFVTENTGITDIDLTRAYQIFQHAADFTLWIDARDQELFNKGHIVGAEQLHLYEKHQYLDAVLAKIEEKQPAALVVYCKGKECTDSHHLAQDLQGMGFNNILVYKDGFDDWYKAGLPIEGEMAGAAPEPQTPTTTTPSGARADSADPGQIAELVTTNNGITDISLQQARDIHAHAADFTLWIDARDQTLYDKGHISGAHLLHLYEKHQYLDTVLAEIEAKQPAALIVYCKGKECTDSHHLAQDLQGMGFNNIFVFKDGFDDWYKAGLPIEGELAAGTVGAAATTTSTPAADDADPGQVAALVTTNSGITDISLKQARDIHTHAADFTLWIDARDQGLYDKGHISGAHLLHLYEKSQYLEPVLAEIEAKQPAALIVYCKGKECTDSHHLAQDLQGMGFNNIFVFKDGFDDWYKAGYPIEGELASAAPATAAAGTGVAQVERPPLEEVKPPGMYLEHVIRDMLPFVVGILLLVFWRRLIDQKPAVWFACWFVGAFFIWAALPKIGNPFLFAKDIWNYDIAPSALINISALWLPMLELLAALAVMTGVLRRGGGLIISGLLVIFIVAVSFNVLRGHEFNCGCTSTATLITDTYLAGWNDKYMLILRDVGLMVMSAMAVFHRPGKTTD
ncbi:rhodanese-like domain-containing protein [Acanthopleuribacter pedis]|uniref:Rhodanese domain-containing protein n=1 Tax=Acanthopleuribacter pedis TaxID=442870 RepID=A0A8J7QHH5_9BACT|nr:rhodanese-like domain-containing protein [Acanthopleuribacter pedis]MBO1320576.1 hypothetical protein [Acanthopleuribacter pedis]